LRRLRHTHALARHRTRYTLRLRQAGALYFLTVSIAGYQNRRSTAALLDHARNLLSVTKGRTASCTSTISVSFATRAAPQPPIPAANRRPHDAYWLLEFFPRDSLFQRATSSARVATMMSVTCGRPR